MDQREIILLREFENLTYREIADALGCPEGTVMSRLHSARRALQEELTGGSVESPPAVSIGGETGAGDNA